MIKWILPVFFLFSTASAYAEDSRPQPSLFGVSLGMTYDQAHEIVAFLPVGDSQGDGTSIGILNRDIADVLFEMMFTYNEKQNTVMKISALFPSKDFESVSKALSEKYGSGKTEKSVVKTGMGVEHEQIEIYWLFPGSILHVRRFGTSIDKSYVTLTSDEASKNSQKNKTRKVEELKKGI